MLKYIVTGGQYPNIDGNVVWAIEDSTQPGLPFVKFHGAMAFMAATAACKLFNENWDMPSARDWFDNSCN